MKMDKKGKSVIILGLIVMFALTTFAVVSIAHTNPQGKPTHPVGIETASCQDAYAGAEEQFQDRGKVNPRLLNNTKDKCGFEFDKDCSIEFGEWTQWFDRDEPSAFGDFETLVDLRNENPGVICDNPAQIECQTLDGTDYIEAGQVVTCNTEVGFFCRNADNGGSQTNVVCEDYRVRFSCETTLVCGETCITRVECSERGEGWSVHPIDEKLCESGLACGIAATFDCICPFEDNLG